MRAINDLPITAPGMMRQTEFRDVKCGQIFWNASRCACLYKKIEKDKDKNNVIKIFGCDNHSYCDSPIGALLGVEDWLVAYV